MGWCVLATTSDAQDEPSWWVQMLLDFLEAALCYLVDLVWPFVDYVLAAIPPNWAADFGDLVFWLGVADTWIPIRYGVTLLIAWLVFVVMFIAVKIVLKLLPWVG